MQHKCHWTLDDIPWNDFDAAKVDPMILRLVKAASMVEYNGADYATYLCNVFHDDPKFQAAAKNWAQEEVQHGAALGRWAQIADPDWDFDAAFSRFLSGYRVPLEAKESVRGSRAGELVARCIVEVGTSSYYGSLMDATDEPVLKAICQRIAADEFRHYKLFYEYLRSYQDKENIGKLGRLWIALGRIRESEDDELAYAYYAANTCQDIPYDRKTYADAYMQQAYCIYKPHRVERAAVMVAKAAGLNPKSKKVALAARVAQSFAKRRAEKAQFAFS